MGLFIKTRRTWSLVPLNEAMKRRALAALHLLRPFLAHSRACRVGVYRYAPIPLKGEPGFEKHIPFRDGASLAEKLKTIRAHVRSFLEWLEKRTGSLYESYVVVELEYMPPPLDTPIIVYVMVNNGTMGYSDIELEVYEWVRGEEIVETIEETLEILGYDEMAKTLLRLISVVEQELEGVYSIVVAVLGRNEEALDDFSQARGIWLPSRQKLLSQGIDALRVRGERGDLEAAQLYDYYKPHRKDVVVSLIGNRSEYLAYLHSLQARGLAEVEAGSLILYSPSGNLEAVYRDLVERILAPFALKVLRDKYTDMRKRAEDELPRIFGKL